MTDLWPRLWRKSEAISDIRISKLWEIPQLDIQLDSLEAVEEIIDHVDGKISGQEALKFVADSSVASAVETAKVWQTLIIS